MIDGCLEWQRIGLAPPPIVTQATVGLLQRPGHPSTMARDCTEDGGPYAFTPSSPLFASWRMGATRENCKQGRKYVSRTALVDEI